MKAVVRSATTRIYAPRFVKHITRRLSETGTTTVPILRDEIPAGDRDHLLAAVERNGLILKFVASLADRAAVLVQVTYVGGE